MPLVVALREAQLEWVRESSGESDGDSPNRCAGRVWVNNLSNANRKDNVSKMEGRRKKEEGQTRAYLYTAWELHELVEEFAQSLLQV